MEEVIKNSEVENQNEQISAKELLALIKELAQIQAYNAMISAQIFAREGKNQINDKANDMKDKIMQQAVIFGQKAKKVEETYSLNKENKSNILQEYKESLLEIQEQYEIRNQAILRERTDWQNEEQATMLKEHELKQNRKKIKKSPQYDEQMKQEKALAKEIKKALDKGDLDTVTEKNEELKRLKARNPLTRCEQEIGRVQKLRKEIQQMIVLCEKELENCEKDRNNRIEEATQDKDNKLMEIKKQNVFQKIAGGFMNKINGAKRFKDNVIKKVAEKVGYIKNEKFPEIKQDTAEKISSFKDGMRERKEQILDKGRETKEQLMQKAEAKLKESIEQSQEKNTQYKIAYADAPEM